ncbi:MAG TPA: hypothetical protein VGJ84_16250 [Polyangiaceae bacterium]|jgi:hypothetical protein
MFDEVTWFNTVGWNNSIPVSPPFRVNNCKGIGGPSAGVKSSGVGAFISSATWMDWVPPDWWADQ